MCLTKDPSLAATERRHAEAENERVMQQTEVWTYQQYLVWQQIQLETSLGSAVQRTPRKKKRKEEEEEEDEIPRKRRSTDGKKHVKKRAEGERSDVNGELKNEGESKSVKDEPVEPDSDYSDNNNGDDGDVFEDLMNEYLDVTYEGVNEGSNVESDEEELPELPTEDLLKVEVKVKHETESGDEGANDTDFDFSNDFPNELSNDMLYSFWEDDSVKKSKKSKSSPDKSPKGELIPCPTCGKVIKGQYNLASHIKQVHEKMKTCRMCKQLVTDLKKHRMTEHPETVEIPGQPLECVHCSMTFKKVKYLRTHMRNQHSGKDGGASESTLCPICAKEVRSLSTHMADAHPKDGDDQHPCLECDKVFQSKRYLRKHVANCHRGKLICPFCSKLCSKSHIHTAHKEEPSICDICCATFKNKHALSGHKRKVHAEKVVVTCPDCYQVRCCVKCRSIDWTVNILQLTIGSDVIASMIHWNVMTKVVKMNVCCCRCSTLPTSCTTTGTRCTGCRSAAASSAAGLTRTRSCCRSTSGCRTPSCTRPARRPASSSRSSTTPPPSPPCPVRPNTIP